MSKIDRDIIKYHIDKHDLINEYKKNKEILPLSKIPYVGVKLKLFLEVFSEKVGHKVSLYIKDNKQEIRRDF